MKYTISKQKGKLQWKKIVTKPVNKKESKMSVKDFRKNIWVKDGIFSDFIQDDYKVYNIPAFSKGRIRIPQWDGESCINCKICLNNCPQNAIENDEKNYLSDESKCIGCGICEAVCPKQCWSMLSNRKEIL